MHSPFFIEQIVADIVSLYAGVPYDYYAGPDSSTESKGINCQKLTHLVLKKIFDVELPPFLKSREIFLDTNFFRFVTEPEQYQIGDVFCFGSEMTGKNKNDQYNFWKKLHLAVYIGQYEDKLLFLHASFGAKSVAVSTLTSLQHNPEDKGRHKVIYGVKRLKQLEADYADYLI